MAQAWTPEETAFLKSCNSRQEAKQLFFKRFPESTRLPETVGRRFYDECPDKREPKWSDAEKAPILTGETVEDAIAEYQKLFPQSPRSLAAIRREWYELRPEKRYLVPCGRKKGSRNKAPLPGTAREKYHIPFSTKQNKTGYNHAVYICKKFDLPYTKAIELEKKALIKLQEKTVKSTEKAPRKACAPKEKPVELGPLFKLLEKNIKKERPPKKIRIPKEKTPRKARVRKPRQVQEKPVQPEPEMIRCARCGSPISPAYFEYTEKTGLCIPCWEESDLEDMAADMAEQVARGVA